MTVPTSHRCHFVKKPVSGDQNTYQCRCGDWYGRPEGKTKWIRLIGYPYYQPRSK